MVADTSIKLYERKGDKEQSSVSNGSETGEL